MDPFEEGRGEISAQAAALLAALVLAADQFTKWWIRDVVLVEPSVITLTPFFNLVWVWNTGVSFGMFGNDSAIGPWALSAFARVVVGVEVWWARNTRET
ncbi:MAG: signal peptidase II, partial [Dehalococcoidia bacterium]